MGAVRGKIRFLKTLYALAKERISSNAVSVGYYNFNNFGDQLTPDVFSYFGLRAVHCPNPRFASALGIGSIIHFVPENYEGYLLGSGLISDNEIHSLNIKPILVRGHLTKDKLGLPEDTLVGDPGLLADRLYGHGLFYRKKWDVGIVPHFKDKDSVHLSRLLENMDGLSVKVIDVQQSPFAVVRDVSECNCILSSSLHGLIVADSLQIKNSWIKLTDNMIGGDFKFNDYYSCYGVNRKPNSVEDNYNLSEYIAEATLVDREFVERIQENISNAFISFASIVKTKIS